MEALQQKAKQQQRVISEFLKEYDFLNPDDPRLKECESITYPIGLRNWSQREYLWNVCRDLLGVGGAVARTHYIVNCPNRENFVEVWASPAPPLPDYATAFAQAPGGKKPFPNMNPDAPQKGAGSNYTETSNTAPIPPMENDLISAVAELSTEQLNTLIHENHDDLSEAITHQFEVAQDKEEESGNPQKVKMVINHSITIDLSDNKIVNKLAWTVAHKSEISALIPDPNQPSLPGVED